MLTSGRNDNISAYRYGASGMESDDEVTGNYGGSYDFGARMYDSRIGRWSSRDKLEGYYTSISPYGYSANTPICSYDIDGNLIIFISGFPGSGVLGMAYWNYDIITGFNYYYGEDVENNMWVASSPNIGYGIFRDPQTVERERSGHLWAQANFDQIYSDFKQDGQVIIVSHSYGAAFGNSVHDYLVSHGIPEEAIVHHMIGPFGGWDIDVDHPNVMAYMNDGDGTIKLAMPYALDPLGIVDPLEPSEIDEYSFAVPGATTIVNEAASGDSWSLSGLYIDYHETGSYKWVFNTLPKEGTELMFGVKQWAVLNRYPLNQVDQLYDIELKEFEFIAPKSKSDDDSQGGGGGSNGSGHSVRNL